MFKKKEKMLDLLEGGVLLLGCAVLLSGVWATARQRQLSEHLVRLHVIARSDAPEDQAVKLAVRDAVLSLTQPRLESASSPGEAEELLRGSLEEIRTAAEAISGGAAAVELSRETYPTRAYESFSLPAGEYTSLRVILGEGEGKNWWCVVYPPLCTEGLGEAVEAAALPIGDVRLISEEDQGYEIRFKLLDWWGSVIG